MSWQYALLFPSCVRPFRPRQAASEHRGRATGLRKVALLTCSKFRFAFRMDGGGSFDAIVARVVVVFTVTVQSQLASVVFSLVGNQIGQRKAIVGGNEINACGWIAAICLIDDLVNRTSSAQAHPPNL